MTSQFVMPRALVGPATPTAGLAWRRPRGPDELAGPWPPSRWPWSELGPDPRPALAA